MRRAIALLIPILCAALVPLAAHGRSRAKAIMNAVGLIDYSSKPAFKPGDWVRYHVVGANNQGDTDDYYVTILIAGEERFWGEDCFWVETRTLAAGSTAPVVVATLMSYSAFDDSLGLLHMKYFMRKTITDISEDGTPMEDLIRRPPTTLKSRKSAAEHTDWSIDTLGADTVQVPRGLYRCIKIKLEEGVAATGDFRDSSARTEARDARREYMTPLVPITHLAREEIENSVRRKSWLIGHSQEGELRLVGLSQGQARLDDFGTGLESGMVPARFRRSLREQDAATSRGPPRSRSKRPG